MIILIGCSLCLEEGKLRQIRVAVIRVLCVMGLPTFLTVFALCVVLLEPASAARGQKASEGATVACDSIAAVLTLTITK